MKQLKVKIIENKEVAPGFYRIRLESLYLAKKSQPGQFLEVKVADDIEPLLRRPLSMHKISKNGVELLYEVVGKGTRILCKRLAGEYLDIIGPLGNGFDISHFANHASHILIAGGVGVAPLVALAESLARRQKVHVLIGACKKEHILCEKEFKKIGARVSVATENGSKGHKGLVTDLLKSIPAPGPSRSPVIYACGPAGMLKAVAAIAKDKRIPCQVSLEERMACGVGVCLGCPVKIKNGGYKMVCKDGPVFNAEEIAW